MAFFAVTFAIRSCTPVETREKERVSCYDETILPIQANEYRPLALQQHFLLEMEAVMVVVVDQEVLPSARLALESRHSTHL